MIVALHGVEFFAYHGFYPEEQKIGNTFIVDLQVSFDPAEHLADDLTNTVNYERLFDILDHQMANTSKLIETVADNIVSAVKQEYFFLDAISVSIKKMNPLIGAKVKYSEVIITYQKP